MKNDKKTENWLRLKRDFFNTLPIKELRKLAGGDSIIILYIELIILAATNFDNSVIYRDCKQLSDILQAPYEHTKQLIEFIENTSYKQGLLHEVINESTYITVHYIDAEKDINNGK